MGTLLQDLGIGPFDLSAVSAIATGFMLASALRSRRDVAIFLVSAAVLAWPIKVIGDLAGAFALSEAFLAWPLAPNGDFQFPVRPTPAILVALFISALAILVWKKLRPPQQVTVSVEEWRSLRNLSQAVLIILTPFLHLWTVFIVPAGGVEGLVATLLLPGLAQVYWIAALWPKTATLSHPMTLMSVVWLCATIVWLAAVFMAGTRRAPASASPVARITFPPRPLIKRDAC
jgi:hypothetical protein